MGGVGWEGSGEGLLVGSCVGRSGAAFGLEGPVLYEPLGGLLELGVGYGYAGYVCAALEVASWLAEEDADDDGVASVLPVDVSTILVVDGEAAEVIMEIADKLLVAAETLVCVGSRVTAPVTESVLVRYVSV